MNCIIIEDEKPAQLLLEEFIHKSPTLNLKGVYGSALDAQGVLNTSNVDLLFLDINLPMISGIDLLKSLSNPPLVIITTAYPEYAIEGFNLDVVDYLLKPFAFTRFLKATNKALKLFKDVNESFDKKAQFVESPGDKTLVLNIDKTLHRVPASSILFLSSDKDYVVIQTLERKYVLVGSLVSWEEKLQGANFSRIHKSHIVNLKYTRRVSGNEVSVNGEMLPIGRTYKSQFLEKFMKPS